MKYNPSLIEKKWQKKWDDLNIFKAEIDYKKPKYYVIKSIIYNYLFLKKTKYSDLNKS